MWHFRAPPAWMLTVFSLFTFRLPEQDTRLAIFVAATLNLLGMSLQIFRLCDAPGISILPMVASMFVACILLFLLSLKTLSEKTDFVGSLFAVNAIAISCALYYISSRFGTLTEISLPFQGAKLGALLAGMLAPGFLIGLVSIGAHVLPSIIQFLLFPQEIKALVQSDEPWAMLGFAMGGVFVLAHRMRIRQLEQQRLQAYADIESSRRISAAFLELRDLMNTPIQSITIAAALLGDKHADNSVVLEHLQQSCARLREISLRLKNHVPNPDAPQARA